MTSSETTSGQTRTRMRTMRAMKTTCSSRRSAEARVAATQRGRGTRWRRTRVRWPRAPVQLCSTRISRSAPRCRPRCRALVLRARACARRPPALHRPLTVAPVAVLPRRRGRLPRRGDDCAGRRHAAAGEAHHCTRPHQEFRPRREAGARKPLQHDLPAPAAGQPRARAQHRSGRALAPRKIELHGLPGARRASCSASTCLCSCPLCVSVSACIDDWGIGARHARIDAPRHRCRHRHRHRRAD